MKPEVFFRRIARREFEESIQWYDRQEPGLGHRFRLEVQSYLDRIAASPERFPKVRDEVRRAVLRVFPFKIHYIIEEDSIVVLAVFHGSRNPDALRRRR